MRYPMAVAFIVSNEFCERFCFFGMRAILVLYLTHKVGYTEDDATTTYHVFTSLAYFFPILGAIIADSWLGRFRTIMYLSAVYVLGSVIVAVGAIPTLHLPANALTIIGLLLIALGTGGIKPCVSAFGGDQFKIPEQAKQLAVFFSLFYMAINVGSLVSTLVTPILREDVHCFGEDSCFSLAFGVPGALMVVSIAIFVLGRPFYNITNPTGNIFAMVTKCCNHAFWTRRAERPHELAARDHWLDYAQEKYGAQLVDDIKVLFRVLLLFVPLPIFWTLFDQQGSRWTFQASRMDGVIAGGFTIKPDQMQVVNPVLIIVFIPIWDAWVYPLLARCGIRRPLQKLAIGMLLVAVSFLMSAALELKLESLDPSVPASTDSQLRVLNGVPETAFVMRTSRSDVQALSLAPMSIVELKNIHTPHADAVDFELESATGSSPMLAMPGVLNLRPGEAVTYFVTGDANRMRVVEYVDAPGKPMLDKPLLRVLFTSASSAKATAEVVLKSQRTQMERRVDANAMNLMALAADRYDVYVNGRRVDDGLQLATGGVYAYLLSERADGSCMTALHTIVQPNSVHILWQLPQYVVVTAAEIMFSVTGLEFSYTESPESMKSVLQACWQLTVTFGNILVVIIAQMHIFDRQSSEFMLFAGLMLADMVIFMWLAMGYRYNNMELNGKGIVKDRDDKAVPAEDQNRAVVVGVENSSYR